MLQTSKMVQCTSFWFSAHSELCPKVVKTQNSNSGLFLLSSLTVPTMFLNATYTAQGSLNDTHTCTCLYIPKACSVLQMGAGSQSVVSACQHTLVG